MLRGDKGMRLNDGNRVGPARPERDANQLRCRYREEEEGRERHGSAQTREAEERSLSALGIVAEETQTDLNSVTRLRWMIAKPKPDSIITEINAR